MKIIRHTARDMRQALRAVREQLGEDAVILSSRRTGEGVEVTAAVDFDASTLEAGGFSGTPPAAALPPPAAFASAPTSPSRSTAATNSTVLALTTGRAAKANSAAAAPPRIQQVAAEPAGTAANVAAGAAAAFSAAAFTPDTANGGVRAAPTFSAPAISAQSVVPTIVAHAAVATAGVDTAALAGLHAPAPAPSYDTLAALERPPGHHSAYDAGWISEAARQAVAEHVAAPRAPVLTPRSAVSTPAAATAARAPVRTAAVDPVEQVREDTLTPLASNEVKAAFAEFQTPAAPSPAATDAMGNELKTLRRMLENQLAHLAWNDLTRRAPVHTEILRELTEIGITQDLAEHLARQLPEDTDITFARRFTIAGLSQYLKVTGDHWLDDGGRVAFAGATGVGKTTTLAKIAVRWVLRHGPRDIALIAADSVRIGAQDQLQSLAQLLGVPVYTPEKFESLPTLLSRLNERLILIDTPGSSVRDPQLANRLAVLSNAASQLQTALVLAASTQAGAIEESVRHFAPANPACCVLTKLDEAASLGGVLSVLIRARLPVSYMSEGQRVPEDLRPARALELVSAAVRLAKARGAAADEDLLRRRFGKTAHGIS